MEPELNDIWAEQVVVLQRALDVEREKVKELKQEGLQLFEWRLALHSLTPGGSEFCTPEACESWVRKSRASQHEHIIEQIKQRKELQAQLATLQAQLNQLVRFITVHVPGEPSPTKNSLGAVDCAIHIIINLQAQIRQLTTAHQSWTEALGEWLWNCTNLLGDYHIKTVQDFNEEVNRRIAWLMQHLDHTLPPPMTDEERDRMRRLSEDNECKDSLIETLQAQLPAEMPGCTILFKECEKGHGRLTATNWIDHGCGTCALESLKAQLADRDAMILQMGEQAAVLAKENMAVKAQLRQVEGERDGLEQNCLNNHVTTEQADAKVMKLEGEKGMWASERIDLLTQLENAEADLTTLRQLVEAVYRDLPTRRDWLDPVLEARMQAALQPERGAK